MACRKKIGIFYSYNENWIGGTYYIENLIKVLYLLPDQKKPKLFVISSQDDFENIKKTSYPFLVHYKSFLEFNLFERIVNKGFRIIFRRNLLKKPLRFKKVDVLFPILQPNAYNAYKVKKIYWIPDFQEQYYPEFFSESEIEQRIYMQKEFVHQNLPIVFSSIDVQNDFRKFYPNSKNKTYVLRFSVSHPEYESIDLKSLLEKYKLPQKYFFVPNQFWKHKNHLVIFKALKILHEQSVKCVVAFSGKESDSRDAGYFKELKDFVSVNKLEEEVRFLGFIDRREQLALMKNSLAIIQPSLFEGWSTVVEESKAMNKLVIASDINVHKEQLQSNVLFFERNSPMDLVEKIKSCVLNQQVQNTIDYNENRLKFAEDFMNIINE
jgi:glycosyltransferase involved in cell wall biosynthesis